MRRVLLLSAYRSDSHAYWADWLQRQIDDVDWQVLQLPGRHFAWRIRGNPLSWLDALPDEQPDVLLATSMVDLATLRGLHPHLVDVPTLLYFHENQFAYPLSDDQVRSLEPAMVQIYAGLAADRLLFNSAFNRDSYIEGVAHLLDRMPDQVPRGVSHRLGEKSSVLPVGIDRIEPAGDKDRGLILWNHRWEYDKRPELFAGAVIELAAQGLDFRLALLGARGRNRVPALERLRLELSDRIVADGFLPRDEYRAIVSRAGIAVSTASHEFQGLSMLEAVSAGAIPVVPDALCYPEQYPSRFRYPANDPGDLVRQLRETLSNGTSRAPDVTPWSSASLRQQWRSVLLQPIPDDHQARRREADG
jgi:glycosyltransferase involved in cell wall biosynthesis